MNPNRRFFDLLERKGIFTHEDSDRMLNKFHGDAFAVLEYLIQGNAAPSDVLGNLWGQSMGIAYVDLEKTLFQTKVVRKLPADFARGNRMIPLYHFGDAVTVAMADPTNSPALREAERLMGCGVSPVFSLPGEIEDAIDIQYQFSDSLMSLLSTVAENSLYKGSTQITTEQLRRLAEGRYIVELVRGFLLLALRDRAGDIHIEPEENMVRVRFRIDGVLHERLKFEKSLLAPLISRLKIMAELDITERRKPQDGRLKLDLSRRSINFRLSTVPFIYGEKAVLRVLGQISAREIPDLRDLNFSKSVYTKAMRVVNTPNGVFFVTGPTGSGKTTTLFSALKHLNKPGVNIVTIEDPVEYRLRGVNQMQVNAEIGVNFAVALRSFLRQDPDIVLIGEIRDLETAKIASQAALTGHLVLATMHTNNALQAVTRLVEIGVEPFLVAPSIIGVMAQRLVRRICDHCKKAYKPSKEQLERYFTGDLDAGVRFFHGEGCTECNHTGYKGRIAIHELFVMTEKIKSMVAQNASILDIEREAHAAGFKGMRHDGLKKVVRGFTTIDEIERVVSFGED